VVQTALSPQFPGVWQVNAYIPKAAAADPQAQIGIVVGVVVVGWVVVPGGTAFLPPPPPVADFTAVQRPETFVVDFADTSTLSPTAWQWDFGDGNSSGDQNPVHSYSQSGTFDVMLSVTTSAGCTGQYDTMIQILDQPLASFNATQAGLTVTFENTSVDNGNASYSWDFDDGNSSTEEDPSHQYSSGGVYNVCLTVFDSTCMTSSTFCSIVDLPTAIGQVEATPVTIYPNPANDIVTIAGLNEAGIEIVTLFNSIGQRMIQTTAPTNASELQINTRSLAQGIYTIELRKADESVLQKKINVIH
jgi:PKD repeat protein